MDYNKNHWNLLQLCVYWISEKQNNRFIEEAAWFGLDISSDDAIYADLHNFKSDEGLKIFFGEDGSGLTQSDLNEIMPIKDQLEDLEDLDESLSEKVYRAAVGMLYLLVSEE